MNSTAILRATGGRCRAYLLLFVVCAMALLAMPAFAAENPVPKPAGLERDVAFWVRVYSEINTNSGFIHDEHNLAVVYETLKFGDTSPRDRQKLVDDARDRYSAALRRIASASGHVPSRR